MDPWSAGGGEGVLFCAGGGVLYFEVEVVMVTDTSKQPIDGMDEHSQSTIDLLRRLIAQRLAGPFIDADEFNTLLAARRNRRRKEDSAS